MFGGKYAPGYVADMTDKRAGLPPIGLAPATEVYASSGWWLVKMLKTLGSAAKPATACSCDWYRAKIGASVALAGLSAAPPTLAESNTMNCESAPIGTAYGAL